MMRLISLLLVALALWAQNPNTAKYPSALPTDTDLLVAKNRLDAALTLSSNIDASTLTVPVNDGSLVPITGVIRIDYELLKICSRVGNTLTVCASGRGFDGSVAQSHSAGASISNVISAWYHNQLAAEIIAITTRLGTNFNGQAISTTQITAGQLTLARGGTGADLSATGGSGYVLKQSSVGAGVTVAALAASELSNGTTGTGSIVLASSPTIVTPTIASFVNATHNHQAAAGGGKLAGASALSDYSTAFVTSITGTANQVTASASVGGVTLSLPQSIHIGATPTFAGLTSPSLTNAGTLALSATGANVITLSTNGSERTRVTSGGNVLIGTPPDDGVSKLQVAGTATAYNFTSPATAGTFGTSTTGIQVYGSTGSGGTTDQLTFVANGNPMGYLSNSGVWSLYNSTATTGSTSLVVRAGAGQSTNALQTWQDAAAATLSSIDATGKLHINELFITGNIASFSGISDGDAVLARTSGTGSGVFATAGSLLYRTRASDAAGYGDHIFYTGATPAIRFQITADNKIGFFGVTPVARQTASDLAGVISALQAYGLLN